MTGLVRASLLLVVVVAGCIELGAPDSRHGATPGTGGTAGADATAGRAGSAGGTAGDGGGGAGGAGGGGSGGRDAGVDGPAPDTAPGDGGDAPVDKGPVTVDGMTPEAALLPAGMACTSAGHCATGFCVDGVCCQSACDRACHSCKQPGSLGTCAPAGNGDDPRNDCAADEASSCKRDGTCDGNGGCRMHAAGTICAPPSCASGTESSARTCDGLGTCRAAITKKCDPYVCAGTVCGAACTAKAECVGSSFCEGGKCSGLLAAGTVCTAASQCLSGFCVDGVCCQSACGGACSACNVAGSVGSCVPVAAGEDPANECPTDPVASCSRDGSCDGRGACRVYAAGTACAPLACAAGVETSARTCDGAGACRAATMKACAPYLCGTSACATSCAGAADCQAGNFCDAGQCKPKLAAGVTCQSAGQCSSGNCVDGVCCDAACGGTCQACNLAGNVGKCTAVPSGQDPSDECAMEPVAMCGRDGTCDGKGACGLYVVGTVCGAASCTAGVESSPRTCDGGGTCQAAVTKSCAPFACNGAVCASGCANDGECDPGKYCAAGGVCTPKLGNGEACGGANVCVSGFCVGGVCCAGACTDACSACNLAGAEGTCTPKPATSLIGHWKLDETAGTTAGDSSCNALHGTLREYTTPDWRTAGKTGGALGFNGTSNWVHVPDTGDRLDGVAATNKLTLMAWTYRPTSTPGWAMVASREAPTMYNEHYGLGFLDDKAYAVINSHAAGPSCQAPTTAPTAAWVHLAATWDGTNLRVYLNGTQVCTVAKATTLASETRPLIIGGNSNNQNDDAQELMKGVLDEVVLYSRTLSAAEIAAVAGGGAPPAQ